MKKQLLFLVILTLSTITIFAQNVPNYVPTNGLVGWWPFNGNSNDESGNTHNGTNYGAILSSDRNNISNSAYSFNGSSNFIEVPLVNVSNSNSITISAWVNTTDITSTINSHIMRQDNGKTALDWLLAFQNSGTILSFGLTTGGNFSELDININANNYVNKWIHILALYDGAKRYVYVNGLLIGSDDKSGVLQYTSNATFAFGAALAKYFGNVNGCEFLKGKLDDIAIYNRALTQEEITALYTGTPLCTNPTATITPQGATTFCQEGFVNLNATTGANYTYEWYINGQVIEGATSSTYQANSPGNFTVKISDGACNTTSSPISVLVNQIPSNLVNTSGNTTFCTGGNVTLYALGTGTYKWSNGATTQSINVAQSGDYSVRVSSNGCSATSTNTKVTVNPTPSASITPQGNTTFCQGGFVNLVASGGTTYQWNTSSQNATINVYESGTYSVNVFNEFNCQASASQIVTVNSNPSVTLNALNNVIYKTSAPIQLVGNPSGGSYVGNGVQGSVFKPSNSSLGSKTITYNFTSQQGCSGSASRSTIVADTVGKVCSVIDTLSVLKIKVKLTTGIKAKQITAISVYPNPTSDVLVIESSDFQALGGYRYRILDVLGKEVYNALIISSKTEISLKTLGAKGTYILHIVDANNVSIHDNKIVLE